MVKPVLLTVDDDAEVLRAIERDLRQRYASDYRIVRAASGPAALEILRKLNLRNEPVSLLLADHRMPQMDGIEFLAQAKVLFPDARRVLLTAYADTNAAIRAINDVHLHHYLLKPWDPAEHGLYPVLDDLLEDWRGAYNPPFEGVRLLGTRWSPRSYEVRDFLARQQVPYRWLDVELGAPGGEARTLIESLGPDGTRLPVAILPDGSVVPEASAPVMAARLGLQTAAASDFYQMIIVGGGPAGLAAGVYAASEGVGTLMIEREAPGGQAGLSSRIENYLGFPSGLTGGELARRAVTQARRFGVEIVTPQEAVAVRTDGPYRFVKLANGSELSCHVLMIATGVQWKTLDIPGAAALAGAGIYYGGGSTEAMACKDETVYIVGGANSAGQAAMNFSRYARRVVMLVRGDGLAATMSKYLIDQIAQTPNIEVHTRSRVVEAIGDGHLEALRIACDSTHTEETVPAASLFIFIGAAPRTAWLGDAVERDERGFILTGAAYALQGRRPRGWSEQRAPSIFETNVPGVYAVGDVRLGSVKRVAAGVGEGSMAVQFVHQYLSNL